MDGERVVTGTVIPVMVINGKTAVTEAKISNAAVAGIVIAIAIEVERGAIEKRIEIVAVVGEIDGGVIEGMIAKAIVRLKTRRQEGR